MISRTAEYALRAMLFLASHRGAAVTSRIIARNTQVSQSYLSKVLRDLAGAKLIQTLRGPHGGFMLTRDPAAITLLQVVDATDPQRTQRRESTRESDATLPALNSLLNDALAAIEGSFRDTSLAALLQKVSEEQRQAHGRTMP